MQTERISGEEKRVILTILAPLNPKAVYVFGSHGTDRAHPGSDLDLAVLPGAAADPVACFERANRIADRLGIEVDLVNLSSASTVLAKEVLRTGELVDDREPLARMEFEMRTLSDYARLNEERAAVLAG